MFFREILASLLRLALERLDFPSRLFVTHRAFLQRVLHRSRLLLELAVTLLQVINAVDELRLHLAKTSLRRVALLAIAARLFQLEFQLDALLLHRAAHALAFLHAGILSAHHLLHLLARASLSLLLDLRQVSQRPRVAHARLHLRRDLAAKRRQLVLVGVDVRVRGAVGVLAVVSSARETRVRVERAGPAAAALELRLQTRDLLLELAEHRVLGVLVDLGLVLDVLGAVSVPQGGHGLVEVVIRGADVGDHHRLRVPAERVL